MFLHRRAGAVQELHRALEPVFQGVVEEFPQARTEEAHSFPAVEHGFIALHYPHPSEFLRGNGPLSPEEDRFLPAESPQQGVGPPGGFLDHRVHRADGAFATAFVIEPDLLGAGGYGFQKQRFRQRGEAALHVDHRSGG